MDNEEWKVIEGFERYQVSNYGRVKSFVRYPEGRLLKPQPDEHGYYRVCLITTDGSTKKNRPIARLVATAFIPNPYSYPQVNHKSGIITDNRVENLEWCTQSQNARHSYDVLKRDPTRVFGEDNGQAKLDVQKVKEIFKLIQAKELSNKEIAAMYDVSVSAIIDIGLGRYWSDVTGKEFVEHKHKTSKLNSEQALRIYKLAWTTNMSNSQIGDEYGVSQFVVCFIKYGKTFRSVTKHVPGVIPVFEDAEVTLLSRHIKLSLRAH
jgi:phage portal protein BeeE